MMRELNALFETQVSSVTSNMVRDNAFRLDEGTYSPQAISTHKRRIAPYYLAKFIDGGLAYVPRHWQLRFAP